MRRMCLAAFCFVAMTMPSGALGGAKKADAPSVVVRIKSLNALLQNLNLVVKLVGQEEAAHQIESVIKSKVGSKGIEGIDPTRPIGAYVRFGKDLTTAHGAFLLPIADEKSFLTLLANIGIDAKQDKDGVYTYKTNKSADVYFRFMHGYAYVTSINALSIQTENILEPAKALQASGDATLSIVAHLSRIPDDAKAIALLTLQESVQAAKKASDPGESKAQAAFRFALLDDVHDLAKSVVNQTDEARLDLNVNDKTKELSIDFSITPKPGTQLAKSIQELGSLKSPSSVGATKNTALQASLHLNLPANLTSAFGKVVDEAAAHSLAGIQDPMKRSQADALFKAILPTAKGSEHHIAAAIVGPNANRFTIVAAVKLKDGLKLGATLRGLIEDAKKQMPPADQARIQLDFDKVGNIAIHRFEIPKNPALDALIDEAIGDRNLLMAFRDDAMFLGLGKEAVPTLKSALVGSSAASMPVLVDVDVARMAKWLARTPKQVDYAEKLLAAGDQSRIRVSIEGGQGLRGSVRTHFNALELLVRLGKAEK